MSLGRLSASQLALLAVRDTARQPTLLVPALVLLLPSVALQMALPTYLRTRLALSPWTVVAGSIFLVWLNQVALSAVLALVHARRSSEMRRLDWPLLRLCLAVGTRVTLGLAAAVVPGLWLQARYAFATLLERDQRDVVRALQASIGATRPMAARLAVVSLTSLGVVTLGQGAVAALAEALGTITPLGEVDGRTVFQLAYGPHALTTVLAWIGTAATLTAQAVVVSALFEESCEVEVRRVAPSSHADPAWIRVGQAVAALATAGAVVATVYKIHQHLR